MGEGMDYNTEAGAGNGPPPVHAPPPAGAGAGAGMAMKNPLSQQEQQAYDLRHEKRRSRQRKCLCCCGVCCAILVVIVVLLIILVFTVFRQRDPQIHVDKVTLQGLSVNLGNIFTDPNLSVDVVLVTTVSVKNPNYASFKYKNSTAYIYYQGIEIGESTVSPGEVRARRTAQLTTGTNVHISGSIINGQLTSDVAAGVLPVVTTVQIKGTAKILNIFSVSNVKSTANCTVDIFIANQTQSFHCDYKVKL
ncbi:unnamed protein product [Calypogeia fissa]